MQYNRMYDVYRNILSTIICGHSTGLDASGYDFEVNPEGRDGLQNDGECHPIPDWRREPRSSGYDKIREGVRSAGNSAVSSNESEIERDLESSAIDSETRGQRNTNSISSDSRVGNAIPIYDPSNAKDNRINSGNSRSAGVDDSKATTSSGQLEWNSQSYRQHISSAGYSSEECNEAKTLVQKDTVGLVGTSEANIDIREINKIVWKWIVQHKGE